MAVRRTIPVRAPRGKLVHDVPVDGDEGAGATVCGLAARAWIVEGERPVNCRRCLAIRDSRI